MAGVNKREGFESASTVRVQNCVSVYKLHMHAEYLTLTYNLHIAVATSATHKTVIMKLVTARTCQYETEGVRPREDAEASRFQTCDSTSKKVNNVRSVNT